MCVGPAHSRVAVAGQCQCLVLMHSRGSVFTRPGMAAGAQSRRVGVDSLLMLTARHPGGNSTPERQTPCAHASSADHRPHVQAAVGLWVRRPGTHLSSLHGLVLPRIRHCPPALCPLDDPAG